MRVVTLCAALLMPLGVACASAPQDSPEHIAQAIVVALRDLDAPKLKSLLAPRADMEACFGSAGLEAEIDRDVSRARTIGVWSLTAAYKDGLGSDVGFSDKPKIKTGLFADSKLAAYAVDIKRGCYLSYPKLKPPDCTWANVRALRPKCTITGVGENLDIPVSFDDGRNGEMLLSIGLIGDKWYLMKIPQITIYIDRKK